MESGAQGSPCTYYYPWAPLCSPGMSSGDFSSASQLGGACPCSPGRLLLPGCSADQPQRSAHSLGEENLPGYELSAAVGQCYSLDEGDAQERKGRLLPVEPKS